MKRYLLCLFALLFFVGGISAQKQKRKKEPTQNLDSLIGAAQKAAYKNDFTGADRIMHQVLPKYDTNTDYLTFYGALLSWMGKYDTAKVVLRSVIAKHPNNTEAYDELTDVESWSKDDSMVIVDCNKAMLIPKIKQEPYILKIAEAEINLKKYIPAYDLVRPLLAQNPNDTSAKNVNKDITAAVMQKTADSLFDSALHSSFRRQFNPAEKVAKQLTLEYPDNSDYKVLWCRLLGYRGKADTAEIMLREVLAKEPQNLDAYDAYADDELVTLKFKHSLQLADSGINMPVKGDRTALVITKASAQDNLEDYFGGVMTLDTLVKKHPENKEASDMLKLIMLHYKEYMKQHREDSVWAIARGETERKHYDSALKNMDTVIKWDSVASKYKVYKGVIFVRMQKYDTAIKLMAVVLKKEPHNMDAYDVMTDAELFKKEFEITVRDCDKALKDSMFIKYPSMIPKNDSALMDSAKKDSSTLSQNKPPDIKKDTAKKDSIINIRKDTSKVGIDSDARNYYVIFMLKRAKALFYMEDFAGYHGCVNTLDTLRKVDSTNKEANDLLIEAKIKLLKNIVQLGYLGNYFNLAPFGPWHYFWLQYMRNIDHCPVSAQATYGSIYGLPAPIFHKDGWQYTLGAYPKFTPSTYGDVSVAYSNDYAVFPQWVVTADLYQKLPLNFEVSVGGIYMHFIDVIDSPATAPQDVWIFDPSIAYYFGDHLSFTYRPYIAYKKPSVFVTHTLGIRYVFNNPDTYIYLFGALGTSPFVDYYFPLPQPTAIRQIGLEYQRRLPYNFLIGAMVSYEYLEYYPPNNLWGNMYYLQVVITKRF